MDRYHHGDLRNAVRAAALEIIADQGPAGLSLREVARRAGVSHTAPMHHFGDKRGLLTSLAVEGFQLLQAAMDAAGATAADPRQALVDQVGAYVRLDLDHPGYAAVMWRRDLVDADDPELVAAARATFHTLYDCVTRLEPDRGPALPPFQLSLLVWALAHGVAQLADRLGPALADAIGAEAAGLPASPDAIARRFVAALLESGRERGSVSSGQ